MVTVEIEQTFIILCVYDSVSQIYKQLSKSFQCGGFAQAGKEYHQATDIYLEEENQGKSTEKITTLLTSLADFFVVVGLLNAAR